MIFNEDEFDPRPKKARSALFGAPITPLKTMGFKLVTVCLGTGQENVVVM